MAIFEARGDRKLFLKSQLESTSPVASLRLASFSNWRTAQFDVTYPTPVYRLKLTSLLNWRTARPLQIDVTFLPLFLVNALNP